MGSKCGCGPKEEPWTQEQLDNIVKIQSSIRTSLAVKQRKELKNGKLEELFSKALSLLMGLIIFFIFCKHSHLIYSAGQEEPQRS
jgi:hypothetical protein